MTAALSRDEAVRRLKALEPQLRARGLRSLHLFGSTARGEALPDSDVDLFAEFEPGTDLGWNYADAPDLVAAALNTRVDFTTRKALHPLLKADIEAEAIRIF